MGIDADDHVSIRMKRKRDIESFNEVKEVMGCETNVGAIRRLVTFYKNRSPMYRHANSRSSRAVRVRT